MLLLPERLLLPPRRELPCFCWPLPPFWADRELLESMLGCLFSATGIVLFHLFLLHKNRRMHLLDFLIALGKSHDKIILKMRWRHGNIYRYFLKRTKHFNFTRKLTHLNCFTAYTLTLNSWTQINPFQTRLQSYFILMHLN